MLFPAFFCVTECRAAAEAEVLGCKPRPCSCLQGAVLFEGVSWVTLALNGSCTHHLARWPLLEGDEVCAFAHQVESIKEAVSQTFLMSSLLHFESVLLTQEVMGILLGRRRP